ncbi:hypothetical protein GCM10009123_02660 [Kangiella japonica]|uniref:Tn3 transposase DDE domain-containing protein n=1 Tax=Kangiella japonica TaxID=647384 RepID=A0ABN0STP2_9GAMM
MVTEGHALGCNLFDFIGSFFSYNKLLHEIATRLTVARDGILVQGQEILARPSQ